MAPRLLRSRAISRCCCCRHALPNSTAKKTSGSSCVKIGCQTGSSNPSTISSTTVATLGTRSSISPGRSCPSRVASGPASVTQCEDWYYFYVNARRARYDYLLRQGTWNMMYGVGKTATSILNQAANRRNEEFNNVVGAAKGAWCESVKAFGIKHFGWAPLFEAGD